MPALTATTRPLPKALLAAERPRLVRACRLSGLAYCEPQELRRSHQLPDGAVDLPAYHDGCRSFVAHTCKAQVWRFDDDASVWVAFRGSTSLEDIADNARCIRTRVRLPNHTQFEHVYMHSGFTEQFVSIQGTLEADLLRRLASRETVHDVCFVGHSMGDALAQIAALYFGSLLQVSHPQVRVSSIGFGGPMFGAGMDLEDAFAACVHSQLRVVNEEDIVPSLPPPLFNFKHATPALWLRHGSPDVRWNDNATSLLDKAKCGIWQFSRPLKFIEDHSIGAYLEHIEKY